MLEMMDIGLKKAIAYRLGGKITQEQMMSVLSLFKKKIEKGEKLIVYQEVISIGGAEFDAMVEKLKFFRAFGISHFSRIAVVTHKKWIHKLVDFEGKILRSIQVKGFPLEEKEKAIEFLKRKEQ